MFTFCRGKPRLRVVISEFLTTFSKVIGNILSCTDLWIFHEGKFCLHNQRRISFATSCIECAVDTLHSNILLTTKAGAILQHRSDIQKDRDTCKPQEAFIDPQCLSKPSLPPLHLIACVMFLSHHIPFLALIWKLWKTTKFKSCNIFTESTYTLYKDDTIVTVLFGSI